MGVGGKKAPQRGHPMDTVASMVRVAEQRRVTLIGNHSKLDPKSLDGFKLECRIAALDEIISVCTAANPGFALDLSVFQTTAGACK